MRVRSGQGGGGRCTPNVGRGRHSIPHVFLCLAACACVARSASALVHDLSVVADARRVMDLGAFGFEAGGVLELTVSDISMLRPQDTEMADPIGFTLDWVPTAQHARREKAYGKTAQAKAKMCFVNDPALRPSPPPPKWRTTMLGLEATTHRVVVETPGLYALFFFNCKGYHLKREALARRPVSFTVSVAQWNLDEAGTREYLPTGLRSLPGLYGCFALLFGSAAVAWCWHLWKHRAHAYKLHGMMTLLVLLKTVTLLVQSLRYRHQKATGLTGGLDTVHYVLLTVKGTMLFLLMILAGTGWSVLKPALGELEKRIACAILPLQVAVNVALGVLQETSEGDAAWEKWLLALQFFDLLCCCAVATTIASSMRRVGSDEAQREESLATFRRFYVSLFLFVFVTRVVLAILESALSFRYTWVAPCVQETAAFAFYGYTAFLFLPAERAPSYYRHEDSAEVVEMDEVAAVHATASPSAGRVQHVKRDEGV
eukprot:Rhum_TRINITY_DN5885_c0_g1::Rhum_TRINITY_DN5885_c0_g1_i1::g.18672::m.18672